MAMPYAPVYVHRLVLNARQIRNFMFDQGVSPVAPDLHVTVVYSKVPMDWGLVNPDPSSLLLTPARRVMSILGLDTHHLVMKVDHPHLYDRWRTWRSAGASSDFDRYLPHITVHKMLVKSEHPVPPQFERVEPWDGDVLLGPEVVGPLIQ